MKRYMLDTNMVSYVIKKHPEVVKRLSNTPVSLVCISSITEAELHFGLAKHPKARDLHDTVLELLRHMEVLSWDSGVAMSYGALRVDQERRGRVLAPLDLLIAAHALAVGTVLVSADQAFTHVKDLQLEDWTR